LIEETSEPADPARFQPAHLRRTVRWDRLGQLLSDPVATFGDVYGWGSPELNAERLFDGLMRLGIGILTLPSVIYPSQEWLQAIIPSVPVAPAEGPDAGYELTFFDVGGIRLALIITPLPRATPTTPRELAFTLEASGLTDQAIAVNERTRIELVAQASLAGGVTLRLRPGQAPLVTTDVAGGGGPFGTGRIAARVVHERPDGQAMPLLVAGDGLRVEADRMTLEAGVEGTSGGLDAFVKGAVKARVVLSAASSDGFLARLLPADGIEAEFELGAAWSRERGLTLEGSAGLETTIPLQKTLGPFRLQALHLGISANGPTIALEVSFDGGAKLGPITAVVERIGLEARVQLAPGNLGPVGVDVGFRPPTGAGIVIDAGAITGGGFLSFDRAAKRYAGALQLDLHGITVGAIGLVDTVLPDGSPGFSFLAIITGEFPPIQLGLGFTLNGVGGLIGIHRTAALPALRAGVRSGSLGTILFPEDPVVNAAQIVNDVRTFFPPAEGRHVFGPMAIIGWGTPTLIEAELGLILEVPEPVRLLLIGEISARLPTRDQPLVELHVDVLGAVDFEARTLSIDASLHDSRIGPFAITGDAALRMAWGKDPTFALALGGFHPAFQPPPGFPELRRLTIALGDGSNPRITCQSYLALTSNTVQIGADVQVHAKAMGLTLDGWLGFDVLMSFRPFSFQADFSAGVAVKFHGRTLAGVRLEGVLSGPAPWRVRGEACVSVLFWDACLDFDVRFGEERAVELPAVDPWPALAVAISDARNWAAHLPPTAQRVVTLAAPRPGDVEVLADPMGTLELHQRVVPLNRRITKFGEATPIGADRFDVVQVLVGTTTASHRPVEDFFAPAQFEDMTDGEKLSRPSFERMHAGVAVGSDAVAHGPAMGLGVTYETIIIDTEWEARPGGAYELPREHLVAQASIGAAAHAPLRNLGNRRFAPAAGTPAAVRLDEETYVVASTADLSPSPAFATGLTHGAAMLALREHLASHPQDRGRLQVVPAHEVEGA
jgi:hypothetical protein